jgi:hypothetical protein
MAYQEGETVRRALRRLDQHDVSLNSAVIAFRKRVTELSSSSD